MYQGVALTKPWISCKVSYLTVHWLPRFVYLSVSTGTDPGSVSPPPLYVKLPPEPVYQQNLQNSVREGSPNPPTPPPKVFNPTPRVGTSTKVPPPTVPPPPIPPPPHPSALLKAFDFVPIPNEQGSSSSASLSLDTDLIEFPRQQLQFVAKLGQGQFGEVGSNKQTICIFNALLFEIK